MASEGVPDMERNRSFTSPETSGEVDRLARRDLLILRLEVARRRRRAAQQATGRARPARLTA